MLVPSGVLILFVLGAISVDSAIAFQARKTLDDLVASAANEAATLSLDVRPESLRGTPETLHPVPERADEIVREYLERESTETLVVDDVMVKVDGDVVEVTASARAPQVFSRALPGAQRDVHVRSYAAAQVFKR